MIKHSVYIVPMVSYIQCLKSVSSQYFFKLNIRFISFLFVFCLLKIDFRDRTIKFYYIVITFFRTKGDCFFINNFYIANIKVIILIIFIITKIVYLIFSFSNVFLNSRIFSTKKLHAASIDPTRLLLLLPVRL